MANLHPFATVNHIPLALGIPYVSRVPRDLVSHMIVQELSATIPAGLGDGGGGNFDVNGIPQNPNYQETGLMDGNVTCLSPGDFCEGLEIWTRDHTAGGNTGTSSRQVGALFVTSKMAASNAYLAEGIESYADPKGQTTTYAPDNAFAVTGAWKYGLNIRQVPTVADIAMQPGTNHTILFDTVSALDYTSATHQWGFSGGAVGIGTTTPQGTLQIESNDSNTYTASTFAAGSRTFISNSNATAGNMSRLGFGSYDTSGAFTTGAGITAIFNSRGSGFNLSTDLAFQTRNASTLGEVMRLTATGNVGIGNTSPTYTLDVTGLGHFTGLVDAANFVATSTTATSTFGAAITVGAGQGNSTFGGALSINGTTGTTTLASGQGFTIGGSQFVVQQGSGHVGIGTTSPAQALSVVGTSSFTNNLFVTSASTGLYFDTGFSRGLVRPTAGNRLDIMNLAAVTASFVDGGNVGIGTTSPYAQLSVSNNLNTAINTPLFTIASTTGGTSTSTLMTVLSNGNVGIGTTSPWRTLDVNGTVGFKGLTSVGSNQTAYLCLSSNNEVVQDSTTCLASSRRFKQDIAPLDASSSLAEVMALTPVSFQYTPSYNGALQSDPNFSGTFVGFIAEDVAKIDPRLITVDATGPTPTAPHGVRYENITALLAGAIQDIAVISGTFKDNLIAWLGDAGNGIGKLFAGEVDAGKLCAKKSDGTYACVTGDQLAAVLGQAGQGSAAPGAGGSGISIAPGPSIKLLGDNPIHLAVGAVFADPGATVTDPIDGTDPVQSLVNGVEETASTTIDTSAATTYSITYTATNSTGTSVSIERAVIVGSPDATTGTAATSTPPDTSTAPSADSTAPGQGSAGEETAATSTPATP